MVISQTFREEFAVQKRLQEPKELWSTDTHDDRVELFNF